MLREKIRPRFQIECHYEKEEARERILKIAENEKLVMTQLANRIKISVGKDLREYWSPVLTVTIEDLNVNEKPTLLRCLIGPSESIWLVFLFAYAAAALTFLFGGIIAFSEMSLGIYSISIWSIPISFAIVISTFVAAKIGQDKGRDQMNLLLDEFYAKLEISEDI